MTLKSAIQQAFGAKSTAAISSPGTPLSAAGEFGLIERLTAIVEPDRWLRAAAVIGIGDDCAVIPADRFFPGAAGSLLVSTDTMIEGRHFRRDFSTPAQIGAKLLNVNVSDIAAMGGVPRFVMVAAQLSPDLSTEFVEELYRGIKQAADHFDIMILGGDTTRSEVAAFTITIGGTIEGSPVLRSTAQYGDDIWVTGPLGAARLGLDLLSSVLPRGHYCAAAEIAAISRHRNPAARVAAGRYLHTRGLASAMIDISDGAAQDLGHIAVSSSVSALIELASLPLAANIAGLPPDRVDQLRRFALIGGDDYELLFTAHPQHRAAIENAAETGVVPVRIGSIEPIESGKIDTELVRLILPDGRITGAIEWTGESGYRHF